jgi:hypothetical protein
VKGRKSRGEELLHIFAGNYAPADPEGVQEKKDRSKEGIRERERKGKWVEDKGYYPSLFRV